MEKKIYSAPLMEVAKVNMSTVILTGSPTDEWSMNSGPVQPGAPARNDPAF